MNKIFLIGNLTRDPELSETNSGVAVCRFGIAVNRRRSSADGERAGGQCFALLQKGEQGRRGRLYPDPQL